MRTQEGEEMEKGWVDKVGIKPQLNLPMLNLSLAMVATMLILISNIDFPCSLILVFTYFLFQSASEKCSLTLIVFKSKNKASLFNWFQTCHEQQPQDFKFYTVTINFGQVNPLNLIEFRTIVPNNLNFITSKQKQLYFFLKQQHTQISKKC